MDGIAAWGEYGGVKPVADVAEDAIAGLAVVLARVFDDYRRAPVKIFNAAERQVAQFDVGGILGRILGSPHQIIVPTIIGRDKGHSECCSACKASGNKPCEADLARSQEDPKGAESFDYPSA